MKIYKTNEEVIKDIKDGVLEIQGDVTFECEVAIDANIRVLNNGNITAWNITAWNISAKDINAWSVTAWNISYYAFCCVYQGIKCTSIKASRDTSHLPICLDGELEIVEKEISLTGKEVDVIVDGKTYKAIIK